jgi:hypothetical protein
MRSLYVTSIQTFSGKTALCLGLGRQMQSDGFRVGYFKPLSTQPREVGAGQYCDEDALFAKQVLNELLAFGQTSLLVVALGAPQRCFRWQGLAQSHPERPESGGSSLSLGRAGGQPHRYGLGGLFPPEARQAWPSEGDRRHRPQDCTPLLFHAQTPETVSRYRG